MPARAFSNPHQRLKVTMQPASTRMQKELIRIGLRDIFAHVPAAITRVTRFLNPAKTERLKEHTTNRSDITRANTALHGHDRMRVRRT
jgi:hypothetical protein